MRLRIVLAIVFATSHALADPARVTCVGDSITSGDGTSDPATKSYPAQLQGLLGAGYAVQNDGHSGATLLHDGDLPYATTAEYTTATANAAGGGDLVMMLGTNDSKPTNWANKASFEGDCEAAIDHYRAQSSALRVWVNLPPPAFANACCTIDGATIANEIIPLLKQCAANKAASTIDVFDALAGQGAHFADGVHPDDTAAGILAQTVHDALVKVPTITLTASASSYPAGATVTVEATPTAAYGRIESVEVLEGTTSLAKSIAAPWKLDVKGLATGTHALTAMATETAGRTAKSSPVSVAIEAPPPTPEPQPDASAPEDAAAPSASTSLPAAPETSAGPSRATAPTSPGVIPDAGAAPAAPSSGAATGCHAAAGQGSLLAALGVLALLRCSRRRRFTTRS